MEITDNLIELHNFGFVNFIPLKKSERDQKKRLAWVGLIDNHLFTIKLVLHTTWQIDSIYSDSLVFKEMILDYLKTDRSLINSINKLFMQYK